MNDSIFMMIGSFMPLALLGLFAERNAPSAQAQTGGPQMGQPPAGQPQTGESLMGEPGTGPRPGGASSIQGLEAFALPAGAVSEKDMAGIQATIEKVLAKISESAAPAGSRADYQTIRSGLLAFQDWLKSQGCVLAASSTYDIGNADAYEENIFITYPGQLPFDIVFGMAGGVELPCRLLVFVTTYDLFNFGSLVKNTGKEDVFIPEKWPEDAPAYWESRS